MLTPAFLQTTLSLVINVVLVLRHIKKTSTVRASRTFIYQKLLSTALP